MLKNAQKDFIQRHIGPSEEEQNIMLKELNYKIQPYPKGQNKSQVLVDISGPVTLFGDKCQPGGNDYPLVERLGQLNELYNLSVTINEVKDYNDTWRILKRK